MTVGSVFECSCDKVIIAYICSNHWWTQTLRLKKTISPHHHEWALTQKIFYLTSTMVKRVIQYTTADGINRARFQFNVVTMVSLPLQHTGEASPSLQSHLPTILQTSDILALHDITITHYTQMQPAQPSFNSKVPLCCLKHSAISMLLGNVTSQPKEWHPQSTDFAKTGSLHLHTVQEWKTKTTHR